MPDAAGEREQEQKCCSGDEAHLLLQPEQESSGRDAAVTDVAGVGARRGLKDGIFESTFPEEVRRNRCPHSFHPKLTSTLRGGGKRPCSRKVRARLLPPAWLRAAVSALAERVFRPRHICSPEDIKGRQLSSSREDLSLCLAKLSDSGWGKLRLKIRSANKTIA